MTGSRPEAALDPPDVLVHRAARGDVAAFARIVRLYHEDMTRVAFVVTGDLDSAAEATTAAWPAARDGLRNAARHPVDLGPWLCSLAAAEAIFLTTLHVMGEAPVMREAPAPVPADDPAGGRIKLALARLDPADRALLALRHLAGFSPAQLARMTHRSRPPVPVRLLMLETAVGGPLPSGLDPSAVEHGLGDRLRAYAHVPVRPVDADGTARRVRAGEAEELTRVISVVISVVMGALVAGMPYLAMLFQRR